ncbi:MAG: aspartate--tRNA ligase [Patescibacteria group bacterium]
MRTLIKEIINKENETVELIGWVATRRDHGKLIFIDLRDRSGSCQIVFLPKPEELHSLADKLRSELVVKIIGKINHRPKGMENPEIETGEFEIQAEKLEILNQAEALPIAIDTNGYEIGEESRMKHRYLDLRRPRLQKNLKMRAEIIKFIRDFLAERDFIEIETPILGKSTPEGARDYLVPSRFHPGKFYALPQSPQQYKQLLMAAGFEKYFQIAKCFRDEDTRGDRQPEFTQLDLEMSFTDENEVMTLIEEMLISLAGKFFPGKKILQRPFSKELYGQVMEKYQSDKPDLRSDKNNNNELAFLWVKDFPLFEYSETEKKLVSMHHLFTSPHQEELDLLEKEPIKIRARAYDIVLNGEEIGGGSIRIYQRDLQEKIFKILGLKPEIYKEQFGHMLEAFDLGTPPHGGIALGLDRLLAILLDEPNIREVIAFPKTGDGKDLMMKAPSEVEEKQLKELNIKSINNK